MSESSSYRANEGKTHRVLFCFGVTPAFFEEDAIDLSDRIAAIQEAFANLGDRFGLDVLGTMDDDELTVGHSLGWPWTCYILADCPDFESVTSVCNIVREADVNGVRLWKYLKVEARVGRTLFFGNE